MELRLFGFGEPSLSSGLFELNLCVEYEHVLGRACAGKGYFCRLAVTDFVTNPFVILTTRLLVAGKLVWLLVHEAICTSPLFVRGCATHLPSFHSL
jgi:hypothetical protein